MAKTQTRRSVSLNRELYDRALVAAEAAGSSLAKYTEQSLERAMSETPRVQGLDEQGRCAVAIDIASHVGVLYPVTTSTEAGTDSDRRLATDDGIRVEYDQEA